MLYVLHHSRTVLAPFREVGVGVRRWTNVIPLRTITKSAIQCPGLVQFNTRTGVYFPGLVQFNTRSGID